MNILVTGANGFLGNHVVRHCLGSDHHAIGLHRSAGVSSVENVSYQYTDYSLPRLQDLLAQQSVDLIIHCAGNGNVAHSIANPWEDFSSGPQLFSNVLEAIRTTSPSTKVVFISSAAVYGNPEKLPVSELSPVNPISPYGTHKWMCERLAGQYHSQYGVKVSIIRIFSAYGPNLRKQLLWDICLQLQQGQSASLFGSGLETRDFVQVQDICRAIEIVSVKGAFDAEIYNVASGEETSVKDLALSIFAEWGASADHLSFSKQSRHGDPLRWRADIGKIAALGFSPSITLKQGIHDYVQWFRSRP